MNKRDIVGYMENLEELNARLVEDVNNGEQELMLRDSSSSAIEKKEIQQKIKVTEETVKAMEKRLIELRAHNDVLMAPKRDQIAADQKDAEAASKPAQGKKSKEKGQVQKAKLARDHPMMPRICELIKQIYSKLHDKELMQPSKKKEITRKETAKTRSSVKVPPTGVKTASITESGLNSLTVSAQTAANNVTASLETH